MVQVEVGVWVWLPGGVRTQAVRVGKCMHHCGNMPRGSCVHRGGVYLYITATGVASGGPVKKGVCGA